MVNKQCREGKRTLQDRVWALRESGSEKKLNDTQSTCRYPSGKRKKHIKCIVHQHRKVPPFTSPWVWRYLWLDLSQRFRASLLHFKFHSYLAPKTNQTTDRNIKQSIKSRRHRIWPNKPTSPQTANLTNRFKLLHYQPASWAGCRLCLHQNKSIPSRWSLTSSHSAARTKFGFPFQNLALQWFRGDLGTALRMDDMRLDYCEFLLGLQQFCGWLPYISKQ